MLDAPVDVVVHQLGGDTPVQTWGEPAGRDQSAAED
jgi:hypothetical protein